jgi:para-aminobenzoate synthetase/4-amino-4-deoxychorismate lyase
MTAVDEQGAPFVLLVESSADRERERGYYFRRPRRILCCRERDDVGHCLELLDEAVRQGHYVAGFVAYEGGFAFAEKFSTLPEPALEEHLVWFGVFDERVELDAQALARTLADLGSQDDAVVERLEYDVPWEEYVQSFERVKEYIASGDTYQVCYSFRSRFKLAGSARALFERLRVRQRTAYSALIDTGSYSVVSLSPELFFRKRAHSIELRPMKGTCRRGQNPEEDELLRQKLVSDPKTRAENVMIVDLLRNDAGRLAIPGSVRVPGLFCVEPYETLLQVTSSVTAEIDPALGLRTLMPSLFPCGSITGAPKLRTMQIIHELESSPRGVYSGSIGYVTPNNDACFNVAIRTLLVSRAGEGSLGVGGGVVVDSTAQAEFEECLLKAEFLRSLVVS